MGEGLGHSAGMGHTGSQGVNVFPSFETPQVLSLPPGGLRVTWILLNWACIKSDPTSIAGRVGVT